MSGFKEVMDSTSNSSVYKKARKLYLDHTGEISCSRCAYHCRDNSGKRARGYRDWKARKNQRYQWQKGKKTPWGKEIETWDMDILAKGRAYSSWEKKRMYPGARKDRANRRRVYNAIWAAEWYWRQEQGPWWFLITNHPNFYDPKIYSPYLAPDPDEEIDWEYFPGESKGFINKPQIACK